MEADLFQHVYDALSEGRRLVGLPLRYPPPIVKVVWSSFDYMAGPELRFAWETSYDCGKSMKERVGMDETADENTSSDSSLSKNTNECESINARDQYEDIDAFHMVDEFTHSDYDFDVPRAGGESSLDRFHKSLTESDVTAKRMEESSLLSDDTEATPQHPDRTERVELPNCAPATSKSAQQGTHLSSTEEQEKRSQPRSPMTTSCGVDSGIAATTSMDSELSSYCYQVADRAAGRVEAVEARYCVGSDDIELKPSTSAACAPVSQCEEVSAGTRPDCELYSPSSAFGSSNLVKSQSAKEKATPEERFDEESALLAELMSGGEEEMGTQSLSDEEFVTKFVLAEQICSTQLSSNPLIHKLCIVPSRRIAFGSYMFSIRRQEVPSTKSSSPAMAALTLIFTNENTDWYLERQEVIERFFADQVSRFKAAHMVENFEDLVYRTTKDVTTLLELFGSLERWPLCNRRLSYIKIQSSHLWDRKPKEVEMQFLSKAVTACLMCKGQCAVVGSERSEVHRLMLTLSLFLEEGQRLLSLSPRQKHPPPFSPYLCLQQVKRSEIESQFYSLAADAHWPVALIDIDRRSVCHTGSYAKHRSIKRNYQLFHLASILRDAGMSLPAQDESRTKRESPLELQVVRTEGEVFSLLENTFLLPLEKAARFAFIDHFHLRLENRAKALLVYAEEASRPNLADKRTALSSQWSLVNARRALSLQNESTFGMVLAKADNMRRGFADFLVATTSGTGGGSGKGRQFASS